MEVELLLEQGLSMPLLHVRSIERVVLNLVLNARDATNGSGKVRVSTASIDAARVAVEVDDDGPGVPAGRETAIFASGATTKVGAGRGLGLAGAATVLRRFGASIELVPSALGGASFRVVLPLR
jgi:two-component system NtrC family sensor kinase